MIALSLKKSKINLLVAYTIPQSNDYVKVKMASIYMRGSVEVNY